MSTRKLIIVAMLCGLAILVAGGIQLIRIAAARDDPFEPLRIGEVAELDGVRAEVIAADVGADVVTARVRVSVGGDAGRNPDLNAAWQLQVGGNPQPKLEPPHDACPTGETGDGETVTCTVAFERGTGTPYLRFGGGGETVVWALDP